MNYRGSVGHVAKSSVGGGERIGGLGEPWFPVKITGERSTGDSGLDVVSYTAVEVWIDGQGNTIEKVGGRVLGTANPGVPLDSATTFVVDDLALARPAHGAGGLLWEMVPYNAAAADPSTPGTLTCTGKRWWGQLRSDAWLSFGLTVTSRGAGACACADNAYVSDAVFDTDSWDSEDPIDICGTDYDISITKVNGIPHMTLTPSGGGTARTVASECYGQGWADFTFPGDIANEVICTDPVIEECSGDNGFTIRAQCTCSHTNYGGPGWYVLAEAGVINSVSYDAGDAVELTSGVPLPAENCLVLCPGGPHVDQSTAEANSCLITTACCADDPTPETLTVTLSDNATNTYDCSCAAGSYELTWVADRSRWEGVHTICGNSVRISFSCDSGLNKWFLVITSTELPLPSTTWMTSDLVDASSCSPLLVSGGLSTSGGLGAFCSGSGSFGSLVDFTVTA